MINSLENEGGAPDLKKAPRRIRRSETADPSKVDRLPPHSIEAEQGVLGCILLSPHECMGETIEKFNHDLTEMVGLVANSETDLHAKIPHGDGQTILREALLTADHNAYHLGALTVMARILKASP